MVVVFVVAWVLLQQSRSIGLQLHVLKYFKLNKIKRELEFMGLFVRVSPSDLFQTSSACVVYQFVTCIPSVIHSPEVK